MNRIKQAALKSYFDTHWLECDMNGFYVWLEQQKSKGRYWGA